MAKNKHIPTTKRGTKRVVPTLEARIQERRKDPEHRRLNGTVPGLVRTVEQIEDAEFNLSALLDPME